MIPRLQFDSLLRDNQHALLCGAGKMGQRHRDALLSHPSISKLSIYDPNIRIAPSDKTFAVLEAELDAVCDEVDFAIVATPTPTHCAMAERIIARGVPCLIEKPMTISLPEHVRIETLAAERNVPVAVGFIERFNPAVIATKSLLHSHLWESIRLSRFNPGSARLAQDSVVSDLMVHDIDLAINVFGDICDGEITVDATSMNSERADYVVASYAGKRAQRIELCCGRFPGPVVRQIEASGPDGDLLVDLLRRRFYFTPKSGSMGLVSGWEAQNAYSNALKAQLEDFLSYLASGSRQMIALASESHNVQKMVETIDGKVQDIIAHKYRRLSLVA